MRSISKNLKNKFTITVLIGIVITFLFLLWEKLYFTLFPLQFERARIIADTYIKEKVKEETIYLKGEYDKASHLYDFSYQSKCCEYAVLVDSMYGKVEFEIWDKSRDLESR